MYGQGDFSLVANVLGLHGLENQGVTERESEEEEQSSGRVLPTHAFFADESLFFDDIRFTIRHLSF